jgi:hypothetical protein
MVLACSIPPVHDASPLTAIDLVIGWQPLLMAGAISPGAAKRKHSARHSRVIAAQCAVEWSLYGDGRATRMAAGPQPAGRRGDRELT